MKSDGRKNLRPPWKPGESGNPSGRPKGKKISAWMVEYLDTKEEDLPKNEKELTMGARIALGRIRQAIDKKSEQSIPATHILMDRTEGSVAQRHLVSEAPLDPAEIDARWARRQDAIPAEAEREALPPPSPTPTHPQ